MSKIIDFSVDEDNMIVVNEYDGFGNVFCKKMKFFCGVFCDEYGCSEVEDIVCEGGFEEEEDEKKFKEEKEKIMKFVSENENYMIMKYSVECDESWLVIEKNDWNLFKCFCENVMES